MPRSTDRIVQRRGLMMRGWRRSIPRTIASPATAGCRRLWSGAGKGLEHHVGELVLIERAVDHLGVDEAEVGHAGAGAVGGQLDPKRTAELLHGGLAHRVGDRPTPLVKA